MKRTVLGLLAASSILLIVVASASAQIGSGFDLTWSPSTAAGFARRPDRRPTRNPIDQEGHDGH